MNRYMGKLKKSQMKMFPKVRYFLTSCRACVKLKNNNNFYVGFLRRGEKVMRCYR